MSLIKFKNFSENEKIEVILSIVPNKRVKMTFKNITDIPDKSILLSGFIELNEHNFIEQSDFRRMNYIYRKLDELTYILTEKEDDIYIEPEIPDVNTPEYPEHIPTVEELKNIKILDWSSICNAQIVNGVNIDIDGNIEHFSYNDEDQVNIKELFDLSVQTNVPMYYHSDGNSCKLYTVEQITLLYTTAAMNKMHHITYFNQLKMYLNTLDILDDINNLNYGCELEGDYLETYNSAMSQARLGMETLLMSNNESDPDNDNPEEPPVDNEPIIDNSNTTIDQEINNENSD